jgi:hypothetical protein
MKAKMEKDTKFAPVSYFTFRRFPFILQSIKQSHIVLIFVFGNLQNQEVGNSCEQVNLLYLGRWACYGAVYNFH